MNGKNRAGFLLILLIAQLASKANASVPYDRPITDLYKETEFIVTGRVIGISASCDEHSCPATSYKLRVESVTKASKAASAFKNGDEITFCADGQLGVSGRYLLFMNRPELAKAKSWLSRAKNCSYVVEHDGMFMPVGDESVFRIWSGKSFDIITYKKFDRENDYFTFGIKVPDFMNLLEKAKEDKDP